MKPTKAGRYVLPFGKYRGRTLDDIASTDEGLQYLDWLIGQPWISGLLEGKLLTYLADPAIRRELDRILEDE
jgi:uncharacterized protein (DUF3820 family)